jgi:hypothetical protein
LLPELKDQPEVEQEDPQEVDLRHQELDLDLQRLDHQRLRLDHLLHQSPRWVLVPPKSLVEVETNALLVERQYIRPKKSEHALLHGIRLA